MSKFYIDGLDIGVIMGLVNRPNRKELMKFKREDKEYDFIEYVKLDKMLCESYPKEDANKLYDRYKTKQMGWAPEYIFELWRNITDLTFGIPRFPNDKNVLLSKHISKFPNVKNISYAKDLSAAFFVATNNRMQSIGGINLLPRESLLTLDELLRFQYYMLITGFDKWFVMVVNKDFNSLECKIKTIKCNPLLQLEIMNACFMFELHFKDIEKELPDEHNFQFLTKLGFEMSLQNSIGDFNPGHKK